MPAAASWGYFWGYIFRAFRRGESCQHRAEIGLRTAVHEMGVYVKRDLCLGVPCQVLHDLDIGAGQDQVGDVCVPLRYNNDKQKKPLFSRGLSVCRLLFNSFSKLKIDENYKEKRRLFY